MDDLNSVLLEGIVIGSYNVGRSDRFSGQRIDIVSQRTNPRQGRKNGNSRFTVALSRLPEFTRINCRRGVRLRVVGFLDRPERGQALVVAEHLEIKAGGVHAAAL